MTTRHAHAAAADIRRVLEFAPAPAPAPTLAVVAPGRVRKTSLPSPSSLALTPAPARSALTARAVRAGREVEVEAEAEAEAEEAVGQAAGGDAALVPWLIKMIYVMSAQCGHYTPKKSAPPLLPRVACLCGTELKPEHVAPHIKQAGLGDRLRPFTVYVPSSGRYVLREAAFRLVQAHAPDNEAVRVFTQRARTILTLTASDRWTADYAAAFLTMCRRRVHTDDAAGARGTKRALESGSDGDGAADEEEEEVEEEAEEEADDDDEETEGKEEKGKEEKEEEEEEEEVEAAKEEEEERKQTGEKAEKEAENAEAEGASEPARKRRRTLNGTPARQETATVTPAPSPARTTAPVPAHQARLAALKDRADGIGASLAHCRAQCRAAKENHRVALAAHAAAATADQAVRAKLEQALDAMRQAKAALGNATAAAERAMLSEVAVADDAAAAQGPPSALDIERLSADFNRWVAATARAREELRPASAALEQASARLLDATAVLDAIKAEWTAAVALVAELHAKAADDLSLDY